MRQRHLDSHSLDLPSSGVGLVESQALGQYLLVPIRHGDLIRVGSNVIPERLYVVDLFLDCESVEAWWRHLKRLKHIYLQFREV